MYLSTQSRFLHNSLDEAQIYTLARYVTFHNIITNISNPFNKIHFSLNVKE